MPLLTFLLALVIVVWAAWIVVRLWAIREVVKQEADLLRMNCHPRQQSIERKWQRWMAKLERWKRWF